MFRFAIGQHKIRTSDARICIVRCVKSNGSGCPLCVYLPETGCICGSVCERVRTSVGVYVRTRAIFSSVHNESPMEHLQVIQRHCAERSAGIQTPVYVRVKWDTRWPDVLRALSAPPSSYPKGYHFI